MSDSKQRPELYMHCPQPRLVINESTGLSGACVVGTVRVSRDLALPLIIDLADDKGVQGCMHRQVCYLCSCWIDSMQAGALKGEAEGTGVGGGGVGGRATADLGSACSATGVKKQSYIFFLRCVSQLSRSLLQVEPLTFGLHFHCRGQAM